MNMAKGGVKVVSEKAKKAKTPAQVAKAQANVEAYQRRCAALVAQRELAKAYRALFNVVGADATILVQANRFVKNSRSCYGYQGTDLEVLAQYGAAVEAVKNKASRKAEVLAQYKAAKAA